MHTFNLFLFAILWIGIVYTFNCLISRKILHVEWKVAILYISTMSMLGVYGEVFIGSVYNTIIGHPLWQYQVLPIHDGYTSLFAPILWGIYGFYLYLFHTYYIARKKYSENKVALYYSFETMIIELLVNLSFLVIFGSYLFYYKPGDLWHLTSIQTLPLYLLAGFIIVKAIKRFKKDPIFFSCMNIAFIFTLVVLT